MIAVRNGELGGPPGGWPEPFRTKALAGRNIRPLGGRGVVTIEELKMEAAITTPIAGAVKIRSRPLRARELVDLSRRGRDPRGHVEACRRLLVARGGGEPLNGGQPGAGAAQGVRLLDVDPPAYQPDATTDSGSGHLR